jgi:thioredoxin 1
MADAGKNGGAAAKSLHGTQPQSGKDAVEKMVYVAVLPTERSFKQFVFGNERVVIKFGAPHCKPCKLIAPTLEHLAKTYSGKLSAGTVDFEPKNTEFDDLAEKYHIETLPVFHFFHNSKHLDALTYQGANPSKLADKIALLLSHQP